MNYAFGIDIVKLRDGAANGVKSLAKQTLDAGATKAEIMEVKSRTL